MTYQATTMVKRIDPFQVLPVELSLLILKHMEPRGMVRSAMVSRSWRDLANDEALWYPSLPFIYLLMLTNIHNMFNLHL